MNDQDAHVTPDAHVASDEHAHTPACLTDPSPECISYQWACALIFAVKPIDPDADLEELPSFDLLPLEPVQEAPPPWLVNVPDILVRWKEARKSASTVATWPEGARRFLAEDVPLMLEELRWLRMYRERSLAEFGSFPDSDSIDLAGIS